MYFGVFRVVFAFAGFGFDAVLLDLMFLVILVLVIWFCCFLWVDPARLVISIFLGLCLFVSYLNALRLFMVLIWCCVVVVVLLQVGFWYFVCLA